jgi:carboxylate-amine ligase
MPLTIEKAVALTAYIQSLAYYLLQTRPPAVVEELYQVYDYNRFQASRHGYVGNFINPYNFTHSSIQKDILATLDTIKPYAKALGNQCYLRDIKKMAQLKLNDAQFLHSIYKENKCLENAVKTKCLLWKKSFMRN